MHRDLMPGNMLDNSAYQQAAAKNRGSVVLLVTGLSVDLMAVGIEAVSGHPKTAGLFLGLGAAGLGGAGYFVNRNIQRDFQQIQAQES